MTLALVGVSYLVFVSVATYPVVLEFGSTLPGELTDPLEHLWIMRWSEFCLIQGRSPFFCPGLNAPTGVPLGYFPTMHFPTVAYLALGLFTTNDVVRFELLWFFGFVSTGLATFLLAWWTVRSAWSAWLAGLAAMLSGPMMMHAHGHLETMQMGAVPLFLIGWLRFLDRPGRGRLAVAVGLYWLVVASAPYFAVLAVFPAVWAVLWSGGIAADRRLWLNLRIGWLCAFAVIVLPGLALLFSPQIWAVVHGFPIARTRSEFNQYGAPLWSSFVPSPRHRLGQTALFSGIFDRAGYAKRMSECSSYLGMITLGLLAYAAIFRVRFPRRGFWWSVLILLVVLSWGSQLNVGSTRISLPAGWIYGIFPPFHLIRVPARFNLFVGVCAAVPASAALADLLGRLRCPHRRATVAFTLSLVILADLAMFPFETASIPPIPPVYVTLATAGQPIRLVDAPMFGSNEGQIFSSLWGYWQSIHRMETTAGYPGVPNTAFEAEIVKNSPFWAARLLDPDYLLDPWNEHFGPVAGVDARDYAWLFLTAHKFDRIVWHQGVWFDPKYARGSARIKALLAKGIVSEDVDTIVLNRDRLPPPDRLTWLCGSGFRQTFNTSASARYGILREGRIVIYEPASDHTVLVRLVEVVAFERSRRVRLVEGDRELAGWTIEPFKPTTIVSPPIHLTHGVHELRLISDSDDRPDHFIDRLDDARTAYSLRLKSVEVVDTVSPEN